MSINFACFSRMMSYMSRGLVDVPNCFTVGELKPRYSNFDLISFSVILVGIPLITILRLRSSVRGND